MKKIKLSEIKENPEKIKEVKVKDYISITTKQMIVFGYSMDDGTHAEGIVDMCIEQRDDGMYYENIIEREIVSKLFLIQVYCENVEFNEIKVNETMYDFYMTNGLYNYVVENIPNDEYWKFMELIEEGIYQELKIKNSLSAILNRGLNKLADIINNNLDPKKLNKLIKTAGKELRGLDFDKLEGLKGIMDVLEGKDSKNIKSNAKVGGVIGKNSK